MHKLIIGGPLTGKTQRLVQMYLDRPKGTGTLFLSFHEPNADDIQRRIKRAAGEVESRVMSFQRFIFWMLREYKADVDLPEYSNMNIGPRLIDATIADAKEKGIARLEYWSQDRNAQRFYARLGLPEISRHYRFRFKAPKDLNDRFLEDRVGLEYLYGACMPEEWPRVKKDYDVVTKHPLEPHLCIGYEIRDFSRKFSDG